MEQEPKKYINELIIDTENAIRHLESKIQNTYRYLATKRIKQIKEINKYNPVHKRQQYIIHNLKKTLENNNIKIAKADKIKLWC